MTWLERIEYARTHKTELPDEALLSISQTCFVGEAMEEMDLPWQEADERTYKLGLRIFDFTYNLDSLEAYLFRIRESAAEGQWPRALAYEQEALNTGA